MRVILLPLLLLLLGAAPVPDEDAAVLRAALAGIDGGWSYCVVATLGEPPFAGYQRDISGDAEREPTAAERVAVTRARVSQGWLTADGKPLAPAQAAPLVAAAAALAMRGDPTPVPDAAVGELNVMDMADVPPEPDDPATAATDALEEAADRLEAEADRMAARGPPALGDRGRIDRRWLAAGQRLADHCPNPSISLSAVAREGGFAFVDVGRTWAPLAGLGETWAMRRTNGAWRLAARRRTWIS